MKCHYKVLGVEQDADEKQIKKAYRKKALKCHPDKNPERLDEATEEFRLVQAAYDVLIDPQERAWYNRHRDEILHKSEFSTYNDDTLDLLQYFTPSAYKGFGQDAKSFYSVYGDVFKRISEEDKQFCSDDSEDESQLPGFGDGESDYDEVVHPFYAAWQAYCTKLSYVWLEKYDVREAPDRRVARIIEKENKKERDKERKKRNEIVRDLVSFVRKRDPRVKTHKRVLEERAAEKAERAAARRDEMLQIRVEEAALYEERTWEQRMEHEDRVAALEEMLKDEFGFSSEEDSEEGSSSGDDDDDQLYCVACDKQLKTLKAFKNHQKSKKHKENVIKLQAEMQEEALHDEPLPESEEEEIPSTSKLTKSQKKRLRQQKKVFGEISDVEINPPSPPKEEEESSAPPTNFIINDNNNEPPISKKKTKKPRRNKARNDKSHDPTPNFHDPDPSPNPQDPPNYCSTCQNEFPSRNKLFKHLKATGHSMLLSGASKDKGAKLKKR